MATANSKPVNDAMTATKSVAMPVPINAVRPSAVTVSFKASSGKNDDANHVNFDLCTNACRSARCGDGILQQVEASEATPAGDGGLGDDEPAVVAEYVEACDDGNLDSSDGCTAECQVARCGDGVVQLGVEACDDGNDSDEDGCTTTCQLSTCGDGIVQPGEACDDGNLNDNDECRNNCNLARCGDGVIQ